MARSVRAASAGVVLALAVSFLIATDGLAGEVVPLGESFQFPGYSTNGGPSLGVAALGEHRFVQVWWDGGIVARIVDASGAPLGDEIEVGSGSPTYWPLASPAVVADGAGGFAVLWLDPSHMQLFHRRFGADGEPLSAAVVVDSFGTPHPFPVRLRAASAGDGVIALVLDADVGLEGRWLDAAGAPLGPRFLVTPYDPSEWDALSAILLSADGASLAVVWTAQTLTQGDDVVTVRTQVFDRDGDPVGAVGTIATIEGWTFGATAVDDADGGYAVVWSQQVADQPSALLARRCSASGEPLGGTTELVAAGPYEVIADPAAAADEDGNWLITWSDWRDIYVQQSAPDGTPIRPPLPFGIDYPTGRPGAPALFLDGGGAFTALWQIYFDAPLPGPHGFLLPLFGQRFTAGCVAAGKALCLAAERFRVEVAWRDQHNGGSGTGNAVPLSEKSGAFWFFRDGNLELVTKMLDARSVNGRFWFFSGAMTEVGYDIAVTDTQTGDHRTYHNEPGTFHSFADIEAFDDEPGGEDSSPDGAVGGGGADLDSPDSRFGDLPVRSAVLPLALPTAAAAVGPATSGAGPCPAAPQVICLGEGERFALSVDWIDPHNGGSGSGQGGPLTPDTGAFWFFNPANVELAVKILDGRTINGHFWVFYASLTDVEFRLTLTDRESGHTRFFDNPPFHLASAGHTDVFGDE